MNQKNIIKMLEILVEAFKDIQVENLADESREYSDDEFRSKAKYVLLRIFLEDDDD